MLHLENFFEKSFALLLTTPILLFENKKVLTDLKKNVIIKSFSSLSDEQNGCLVRSWSLRMYGRIVTFYASNYILLRRYHDGIF